MKLPDNVGAQLAACVNATLRDITIAIENGATPERALLSLAFEIISRESDSFVVFARMGDREVNRPDVGGRAYALLEEGVGAKLDEKLVAVVRSWLLEHGA